jgi:hypothetical protein
MVNAPPPRKDLSPPQPAVAGGRPILPGMRRPGSPPAEGTLPPPAGIKEIVLPIAFSGEVGSATNARVRFDQHITRERLRQLRLILDALDKVLRQRSKRAATGVPTSEAAKQRAARSAALNLLRPAGSDKRDWGDTIAIPIFLGDEGLMELAYVQFEGVLSRDMVGQLGRALAAIDHVHLKTKSAKRMVNLSVTLDD